jgi:ABC-type sugar transport system ATPase subunit
MAVGPNLTLSSLRSPWIDFRREAEIAVSQIDRFSIKVADPGQPVVSLSGGNQQKVVIAKALLTQPEILILDEPTRGIDVGAKEEIHSLIDQAAAEGSAVLVASTDTEELVRLSHRILILRDGVIATELLGDEITVENIERAQLQQQTKSKVSHS